MDFVMLMTLNRQQNGRLKMKHILYYILPLFIVFQSCNSGGGSASKEQAKRDVKLNKIYKDKLAAYKSICNFKMNKLQKRGLADTIIATTLYQKDRIEFLKMIVETNYYNLELKSDYVASNGPKNLLRVDNYSIQIADAEYKYGKNKARRYCDEDIILMAKDFNEKWPPQKVPHNTEELYDYIFYKSEMVAYLLQNKCF